MVEVRRQAFGGATSRSRGEGRRRPGPEVPPPGISPTEHPGNAGNHGKFPSLFPASSALSAVHAPPVRRPRPRPFRTTHTG